MEQLLLIHVCIIMPITFTAQTHSSYACLDIHVHVYTCIASSYYTCKYYKGLYDRFTFHEGHVHI